MTRSPAPALLAAVLLHGCLFLPDLERGKRALVAGDAAAAEEDLAPLAELGYVEAQMRLAKAYAQQQTPESLRRAVDWYRQAMQQDPTQAVPLARVLLQLNTRQSVAEAEALLREAEAGGDPRSAIYLVDLYTDYPERDRDGRAARLVEKLSALDLPDAETAVVRWYRHHSADPRFATQLLTRCERALRRQPECLVDLARHYRSVGAQDRLPHLIERGEKGFKAGSVDARILARLGWTLVSDDYASAPMPEAAHALLAKAAPASTLAQLRLARVLIEYPHLDPDARPEQLLLKLAGPDNPEADLALGRLYLKGQTVPADPRKALEHLKRASASLPAAHYYLGDLYKRGQLGRPDPVQAAFHLLTAARQGYPRADLALAQLYSDNRGVRVNTANAFVFATLAASSAIPEAGTLATQLKPALGPDDARRAKKLLEQELTLRQTLAFEAVHARGASAPGRPE